MPTSQIYIIFNIINISLINLYYECCSYIWNLNNTTDLKATGDLKISFSLLNTSTLGRRNYSTSSSSSFIDQPQFITGFSDAEGCFIITLIKNSKSYVGYYVQLSFQITLNEKDIDLLKSIRSYFGVGSILNKNNGLISYQVTSIKDLKFIIDHFNNYSLLTKKKEDFELFKMAYQLISNKEHLTKKGLTEIVGIKAVLNKGLPEDIKQAFPNIPTYLRPEIITPDIKDPYWVAGFTEGDGCFSVSVLKSKTISTGIQILLRYQITQHVRDAILINKFKEYFSCGNFNIRSNKIACDFIVSKSSDIFNIIIPFFEKYPLFGVKAKNYEDFKKVAEIVRVKGHLTDSGLKEIIKIKSGMNTGRT